MRPYYKLADLLKIVSKYGLKTIKNIFLLKENLEEEVNKFEGPFLIVSDTKDSEKYFLTLNISCDKFEEYDDLPEDFKNGWNWRFIPLIHFLSKENIEKNLLVWAEGYVKSKGYEIIFSDGPAEINVAGVKEIIEIIERIDPSWDVRFTFDSTRVLSIPYSEMKPEEYNQNDLFKIYNIIN